MKKISIAIMAIGVLLVSFFTGFKAGASGRITITNFAVKEIEKIKTNYKYIDKETVPPECVEYVKKYNSLLKDAKELAIKTEVLKSELETERREYANRLSAFIGGQYTFNEGISVIAGADMYHIGIHIRTSLSEWAIGLHYRF